MNFIIDGKVEWGNIGWFTFYCLNYVTYQTIVVLTFYFCILASLNAGVVTTIWSITPLFTAMFAFILFGERLSHKHLIGLVCLVLCVALISMNELILRSNVTPKSIED